MFAVSAALAFRPESPKTTGPLAPLDETADLLQYQGKWYITGYDLCESCCGKTDGITASGTVATVGRTAAIGNDSLPFGTVLYIRGLGERVVEDTGGMGSMELDILCEDHSACYAITGWYDVFIVADNYT